MITRTFKLCLNAGTCSAPYINVSQYDEGETWLFELYSETGERYIPSTGAIVGVKSDGHGIINTGTVDSEGRVVITETQQMTASAGRAIFELSIDGLTHGTANFVVAVERKPTDDAVMSDSDLSLIQEAVDAAETIEDLIEGHDPDEVITDAVDAWLDDHPEATTTVLDGAITAPKINSTLWDKLLVSEEASGNPASFDDGADDVPVSSLKVSLEPIQTGSGDPSPSNIRPIIGHSSVTVERTGKNLLNPSTIEVGSYTSSGEAINRGDLKYRRFAIDLKAGTYTFSTDLTDAYTIRILADNAVIGSGRVPPNTFTLESDANVKFAIRNGSTTEITETFNCQLKSGSTATAFEPYTGNSYPYTLGREVYGGTVDLATGVLTVEYIKKTITSFTNAWGEFTNAYCVYSIDSNTSHDPLKIDRAKMLSDKFTYSNKGRDNITEWNYGGNDGGDGVYTFAFPKTFTSLAQCNEWAAANPIEAIFGLATPHTYQLTPTQVKTLLGYNNISSTGTVDVIYHADTKLYVDKMTAVDNNIIAPTEETFTATRNYTVNDLVIVNDTLYKVTSNIQNGGTITVNTNVQQTTLGALIKALS